MAGLEFFLDNSDPYARKASAYALGQIGDSRAITGLERQFKAEAMGGIKAAILASIIAIKKAPADKGFSDMDRRKIIEEIYNVHAWKTVAEIDEAINKLLG